MSAIKPVLKIMHWCWFTALLLFVVCGKLACISLFYYGLVSDTQNTVAKPARQFSHAVQIFLCL